MTSGDYFLPGEKVGCVVIHGFSGCPGEVEGLGNYLNQQGYAVYGVLLKGHGTSPEDLARTRWPDWYASVKGAIDKMNEGYSQVWSIGLSLGGALSLYAGSQGLVDGVVALAAPIGLADWRVRFAGLAKYLMPYKQIKPSLEKKEFNRRLGRVVYERLPLVAVESLYNFIGINKNTLPLITVPALVVHSAGDEVISPESGRYIYQHIASTHKEFLQLKDSGHIVTEDVERDLVNERVGAFLQKHAPINN